MNRKGPQNIAESLALVERHLSEGVSTRQACSRIGISASTYYRWQRQYVGLCPSEIVAAWRRSASLRQARDAVRRDQERQRILAAALSQLMLSPQRRKALVQSVQETLGVGERATCRALGQPRSGMRTAGTLAKEHRELLQRVLFLAAAHPRYGYRRISHLLHEEGWNVNTTRIYRLWSRERLQVRPLRKSVPRRRRALASLRRSQRLNDIWAWDLMVSEDQRRRPLIWLSLIDEYTRECLALEVDRYIGPAEVLTVLQSVVTERGVPSALRSDNGIPWQESTLRRWLRESGITALIIPPGAPWHNGLVEAFQSRLRDELVGRSWFIDVRDARLQSSEWRHHYNHVRPHGSLGYLTPAAFAAQQIVVVQETTSESDEES